MFWGFSAQSSWRSLLKTLKLAIWALSWSIGLLVHWSIGWMSDVKCQKSNAKCQMPNVKCQMPNVNKIKLLSERTGAPLVIFIIIGLEKSFSSGHFGTRTIWLLDDLASGHFATKTIRHQNNLVPGQFGTGTIWHRLQIVQVPNCPWIFSTWSRQSS